MKIKRYLAAALGLIILQTGFVSTQTVRRDFRTLVEVDLKKSKLDLATVCPIDTDLTARRIFIEYGAVFAGDKKRRIPDKCIFDSEDEVLRFHAAAKPKSAVLGGVRIELQEAALDALLEAEKEASKKGLRITPRGGSRAGKRTFDDTLRLWNSRFLPGLNYWIRKGKITRRDAEDAKKLPIRQQVARVLEWEDQSIFFSKDLRKSILYSVAAPGASQHIFMLALDVEQFHDRRVREILAKHGWFQTVKSDLPHFTYLGVKEKDLPKLALKLEVINGYNFWVPDMEN